MRRLFNSFSMLGIAALIAFGFAACTDDDDNPITPVDDLVPPTSLKAFSDDGAVGLAWTPSASETQANFEQYRIIVFDVTANDTLNHYLAQAGNGAMVGQLTNGRRYKFHVYAEDNTGKLSDNFVFVTWAPAVRQYSDTQGNQIEVYATTSANKPSGIDIYNSAGKAEVINQSDAAFQTRGDLYVFATSGTSQALEIRTAQNATVNPGPPAYFNSSIGTVTADNLSSGEMTSSPNVNDYTLTSVSIADGSATNGRLYFGKLVRGSDDFYFRMLVRSVNGKLVQGSGSERYLILEFSYQSTPNVPYAKRVN